MINFTDIEFIVLLILLFFLFFTGLRKKEASLVPKYSGIDLPMSISLKGVACVFILMGHFCGRRWELVDHTIISYAVYSTTATIALFLFMYFSGYGLSIKEQTGGGIFLTWFKRLNKVYLPLFFVCAIMLIIYAMLPAKYTLEESLVLTVPKDIWYIHNFKSEYLGRLVSRLLGWKDWYVFCIMIFYSFFYLTQFFTRKFKQYQTLVLWILLMIYFVFAYFYFGKPEAHWYRYCWVFFLGHVHAKTVKNGKKNKWDLLLLVILMLTMLFEQPTTILAYALAGVIIIACTIINKKFSMNSSTLAFLGGISYFFYLSHERIVYPILIYVNTYSVIVWVVLSIIIAYCLSVSYKLLLERKHN